MATLAPIEPIARTGGAPRAIELPAPTAWPIVLALGTTLLFAGLLTHAFVSVLGVVLAVGASVGWFREVLPHEHEEPVAVVPAPASITTERRIVDRLPVAPGQLRAWLPVRTYPISAGVKGGWAGAVAMALLACAYGVLWAGSIWYPINLLGAVIYQESLWLESGKAYSLYSFHASSFAIALVLHGLVSTLVGLIYGAMLPMIPRRPIVLGGIVAPLFWSGLLYSILGLLNPLLERHIDWFWFTASQVAFGLVAGLVVVRQSRTPTRENLPFFIRAGIHAPGLGAPRDGGRTDA